jgi:RNA polymerase sigma factor (sigma-70 family)
MIDDAKWLAAYVEQGSEEAFRKLVERYLPLVYSAATRRLGGDAHMAQDVAQQVFVDFARKARKLSGDAPLGGWLHRHTCFAAATALRAERRRKARETEAMEIRMKSNEGSEWKDLAPILDEAINQLGNKDRTAVVLRFLEQQDLCSVGKSLGISEDAAQKRVARALERLRGVLEHRAVPLSAVGLATLLSAQSLSAVPTNLASLISMAAVANAATTAGFTLTALKLMTMTQVKLAVAGVLVAGVSTTILVQRQSNLKLRSELKAAQEQVQQMQQLGDENQRLAQLKIDADELQRLRAEQTELMQLRGQAAMLRQREQELAEARAENRRLQSIHPGSAQASGQSATQPLPAAALKPAADWNNVGIATPATAFETWNWAKSRGDVDTLAKTLVLDPDAKTKADTLYASLPESIRAKYGSAERMMATMQMNTKPIVAAQVISQDQVDVDNVIVHTQWQYPDGELGQNAWSLHLEQDGWRIRIPAGLVDKLGKGLRLGGLTESTQP